MTFLNLNHTHVITTVVKVISLDCFQIPEDEIHYCCSIVCCGIQLDSSDKFPVQLVFNDYLNSHEIEEVRNCYEIGKIVSVTGRFYLQKEDGSFQMTIYDPIASFLPEKTIKHYEKSMGEVYLLQKTYEHLYIV